MKFTETIANTCRYGEIAEKIWGDWNVIWEDSESDYQGQASFIAEKDGKFCFYEWSYGSCSGCDNWESANFTDEQVEADMRDGALWLNSEKELRNWLDMLEANTKVPRGNGDSGGLAFYCDVLSGGPLSRINAIRKTLGTPEVTAEEILSRSKKEGFTSSIKNKKDNSSEIKKKLGEIGKKRSKETERHLRVMDNINEELAKVQTKCDHDFNSDLMCGKCGYIEPKF